MLTGSSGFVAGFVTQATSISKGEIALAIPLWALCSLRCAVTETALVITDIVGQSCSKNSLMESLYALSFCFRISTVR